MTDPRAIDGDLEVATPSSAETPDGGDATASSDEVIMGVAEVSRRPAPAGLAETIARATGDAGTSPDGDGPTLDSSLAGLDAQLDASAAFEDWSAKAVDPGLGMAGGLGSLPDPGARLDGLAGGTPSRPDPAISRDLGSSLGGGTSSDAALTQVAQGGRDSGPAVTEMGEMSRYATGIGLGAQIGNMIRNAEAGVKAALDAPPSEGGPSASIDEKMGPDPVDPGDPSDGTTPPASPASSPATPSAEEPPAEEPPAEEPPADPDDPNNPKSTTGEDVPLSAHAKATLAFLGVSDTLISRAGTAGPDYAQGDPGGGGGGGGAPDVEGGGYTDPNPDATGPILRDPGDRPPVAGPDYAPGIPGEGGDRFITWDAGTGRTSGAAGDAAGAQVPGAPQVVSAGGGIGAVGAVGTVGATGTTGEGAGAEAGGIGSSSFAMTADADEAAGTTGTATGKDPGTGPDTVLTAGMSSGKDPGTGPDTVLTAGMSSGKDPGTGPETRCLSAGMSSARASAGTICRHRVDEGIIVVDTGRPAAGFADIRPGEPISITGISERFSGNASVTGERHDIGASTWATGDEIFGSWSTTDQPGSAGAGATDTTGDVTAPTAGLSGGRTRA